MAWERRPCRSGLAGGLQVNQLNLAPPVTKIAEEQHFLHWMMLIICTGDLHCCVLL